MALDVYAGTLTRYYTRDWENVVQRQARLDGYTYQQISPDDRGPPPAASTIRPVVGSWQIAMTAALGENISAPISWDEADDVPYFTDRPGWQGYSGLLLWAAYAHDLRAVRPSTLPETWSEDPTYVAAVAQGSPTPYRHILQPTLWIPCKFDFVFQGPSLVREPTWIGSVFELQRQLDLLNRETFRASEQQLACYLREEIPECDEVEHAARFSLALFLELTRHACRVGVPLLLSF